MASRQRKWQIERIEAGLCQYCGDKAYRKGYCKTHYKKKQERVKRWQDQQKEGKDG